MPVWNILEAPDIVLTLANPRAIKGIRGRKTDVGDAEWIAKLHRSGLIVGSFVPPQPGRDLRDLTRHRTTLVQKQTAERNRIPEGSGGRTHQARGGRLGRLRRRGLGRAA
jgi:transposase